MNFKQNKAVRFLKFVYYKVFCDPVLENKLTFSYIIVPTENGKGYGCFALKQENGMVKAGFSFCSPNDRNIFSKQKAREMALQRLEKEPVMLSKNFSFDTPCLIDETLHKSRNHLPSWVKRALDWQAYTYTLRQDNLSNLDLLAPTSLALDEFRKNS